MIILPISLGVFLIWWSVSNLTTSDKEEIVNSFKNANYFWIFLSLFFGLLSHLSRAYRWKYLLEPLGFKPRFLNAFFTVFIGYLINLVFPRAGEIARATAFSKYESIPFEKVLGTIVAERIIDVIMLLLIIVIAFFYQLNLIRELIIDKIPSNPLNIVVYTIVFTGISGVLWYLIRKSKHIVFVKLRNLINGLAEGVLSIVNMKNRGAFLAHTLFIWLMYLLMFYTAAFALPATSHISLGAVITGFVAGTLSIATTNGGLGTYPLGIQQVLVLYEIAANPALALGWLLWSAQTLMILILGGLSFIALPLFNRKYFY